MDDRHWLNVDRRKSYSDEDMLDDFVNDCNMSLNECDDFPVHDESLDSPKKMDDYISW